MMKVKEIYDYLDSFAPFSSQEEWDRCGLSVGSLDADVRTVVVALDVTKSVIAFAKEKNAELVLTHHPLLFHPAGQIEFCGFLEISFIVLSVKLLLSVCAVAAFQL